VTSSSIDTQGIKMYIYETFFWLTDGFQWNKLALFKNNSFVQLTKGKYLCL